MKVSTPASLAALALCGFNSNCVQAQTAATPPMVLSEKAPVLRRAFARLETSFSLPNLKGDPFNYQANDVRVTIKTPNSETISLPAFFDGDNLWRVRHTPDAPGDYQVVSILLNGQPTGAVATPASWKVETKTQVPGVIGIDPTNPARFARDENGRAVRYFPMGHNVPWDGGDAPPIEQVFGKMGAVKENWSRVWMNNWDGKNLDWTPDNKAPGPPGTLSLDAARKWDSVVDAADKNNIPFQMVLQHHGQYSTRVNPQWQDNPYNVKNGGFLQTPDEFFTDAQAKTLTKRKLRYAVARWGYSPSILAWELFNEVQFTDAGHNKKWDDIMAWHREMSDFLRAQDAYDHLITTSETSEFPAPAGWDYGQKHIYAADVAGTMHASIRREGETIPVFVGEYGPSKVSDRSGRSLRAGLWASLMSGDSGAAQYWAREDVEQDNHYSYFTAANGFLKASGLALQDNLRSVIPILETQQNGDLSFGAGGGFGGTLQNEFEITSAGAPPEIAKLSPFLQGDNNRKLMPKPLVFKVNSAKPGQFRVSFSNISANGAHPKLSVDGQGVEVDFPATEKDHAPAPDQSELKVDVPAGSHVVTLENSGKDWALIKQFTLTDYASVLGAYALASDDYFAGWVYHRANLMAAPDNLGAAVAGQINLPALKAGNYRATWWDTLAGKTLQSEEIKVETGATVLKTPAVERDVAVFVAPVK